MLATVLLTHVTLRLVELVVRAAHKIRWLRIAVGFTVSGQGTILQRDGHHAQIAGASLELAHRAKGVAIGATNRLLLEISTRARITTILNRRIQIRAGSNVRQINAASAQEYDQNCLYKSNLE